MTEIGEVSVRKRRSRQEIKRLVTEFETSGLRQSEFCHKHNLALGTLQRQLKGPVGPFFALDSCPHLARFQASREVPDPSDTVGVVHFNSSPEIVKERF
jgi:hypothetical protein